MRSEAERANESKGLETMGWRLSTWGATSWWLQVGKEGGN